MMNVGFIGNRPNKLSIIFSLLVSLFILEASGQSQGGHSFGGLRRSQSDPRLNRNSNFRRQSSLRNDHCKTNYKFDYIQLTLMWAPGVCSTSPQECRRQVSNHFTVHGMWPTIKGTQEPDFCCFDNIFDYKALDPMMRDLNEYWFSYFDDSSSRGFWSHEWLKHGTCARDIPSLRGEERYFGNTVRIAKQLPIMQALANATIIPTNGKPYQSSDIYKALMQLSQDKNIQIDCDYEHHQPIPVLKGLNFCFDANLKPADCPETRKKCQKQLIFPASATKFSRAARF